MKRIVHRAITQYSCQRHPSLARLFLAFLLITSPFLTFAACSQGEGEEANNPAYSYQQTRIDLPENAQNITALEKTDSGKMLLLGQGTTGSLMLWELGSDDSWTELANINELLMLNEGAMPIASPLTKSGKALCVYYDVDNLQEGLSFYLIDIEHGSTYRQLDIDASALVDVSHLTDEAEAYNAFSASFAQIFSLSNDQFLIQDRAGNLFVLDGTQETLTLVAGSEQQYFLYAAAELDGKLYVVYESESSHDGTILGTFDLSTGAISEIDGALKEEFAALVAEHEEYEYFKVNLSMESSLDPTGRITLCTGGGVFELSDNELKMIADAEGTAISDPTKFVLGCVFENQDDFILVCWSDDGAGAQNLLYRCERVALSSELQRTLHVYSLEDNADVRQAVALYSEQHPEVQVVLEIGTSGGVTPEDALRNLNTEILAGAGPDVLFLDGLPIETFLEQGVLHDLTSIYDEAVSSGLYYENVLGAFVRDGACRVLPVRFSFPQIMARSETLEGLDSLPALVSWAETASINHPDSALFCNMAVTDDLLIASYPELVSEEVLNEELLLEFFESVGNLASVLRPSNNQRSVFAEGESPLSDDWQFDYAPSGHASFYSNPSQIFIGQLLDDREFGATQTVRENMDVELAVESFMLNSSRCYVPRATFAICSNSANIELAESFLRTTLNGDYQRINQLTGLSIMRSTLIDVTVGGGFGFGLQDNSTLEGGPFSAETMGQYALLIDSLDTPVVIDSVIESAIYEQLQRYLDGEATLEEAVDACTERINLYLAE